MDLVEAMHTLCIRLSDQYGLKKFSRQMTPMLAHVILQRPVQKEDYIIVNKCQLTYQEMSSKGLLHLAYLNNELYVRLPYLWLWILTSSISDYKAFKFWDKMIDPKQIYFWENWEHFNVNFWALQLCLLSSISVQVTWRDLLPAALISSDWIEKLDYSIDIPNYEKIEVKHLNKQYPWSENRYDTVNSGDSYIVFLNAMGAPFDGFSFIKFYHNDEPKITLVTLQMKWANCNVNTCQTITSSMIMEEYHKVNEAVNKIPGVNDWLLLILSNCEFKHGELPRNCALIYNQNFKDFYGYVFASRATFSASVDVININSAHDWELTFLCGVGMITAKKIIS